MSVKLGKRKNWGSRSGQSGSRPKVQMDLRHNLEKMPSVLLDSIFENSKATEDIIKAILDSRKRLVEGGQHPDLKLQTDYGELYQGDCISYLHTLPDNFIDCIFADPPFNLKKEYIDSSADDLPEDQYLEWTRTWLELCARKLKPGGSLFLYNIPKWSLRSADFLSEFLSFRNWITVDLTLSMPISGRLYPSHYAMLYFTKGKPKTFKPPRLPIKTCGRCGREQNDYGGYKKKMNPQGINLRDVWTDIPPVRHSKYKTRDANELSIKLLDRVLDIATETGDLVFDPFGGSETTYIVSEIKKRRWIGTELGDCSPILERFSDLRSESDRLSKYWLEKNTLFTDQAIKLRHKSGLPLDNYQIDRSQIERALGLKTSPKSC